MKKILIYIFVLSWGFSQFDLESRMLGMSGAYTTVASGYQSIGINPANLVSNKSLSINTFSANAFVVNDFMSMDLYNNLNGADFDNTASASYYAKSDILDQIKGSEIQIEGGGVIPLPILNFAYKNFGFSTVNRTYVKFDIPKTVIDIMLNGNTKDQRFMLGLGGELISCNEFGFTYANKFDYLGFPIHLGFTFKYLQGLVYFKMQDIEENGSYILTEQTSFHGAGKYLVEQAFGGTGTSKDIGILLPEFVDGWNIGASLINLGGSIKWTSNNPTRELLGETFESVLKLRQNEYYYLDFNIDTMSIMSAYNSDDGFFSSDMFKVGIFSDIPLEENFTEDQILYYTVNSNGDSIINVGVPYIDSSSIVDLGDGSYLVPSENLQTSQLQSPVSQDIHLDYPSSLRLGISKDFKEYGILAIDLVTGFDDSFGNSSKFRLSVGTEIIRVSKKFPIRIGFSAGGRQPNSYSLGLGYRTGLINIDLGRKYYYGIIRNKAKGAEYGFNITMDLTDLKNYSIKIKLPKIKLPKLPKLPESTF